MENATIMLVCALNFDKAPHVKERKQLLYSDPQPRHLVVIVISVAVLHSSHSTLANVISKSNMRSALISILFIKCLQHTTQYTFRTFRFIFFIYIFFLPIYITSRT